LWAFVSSKFALWVDSRCLGKRYPWDKEKYDGLVVNFGIATFQRTNTGRLIFKLDYLHSFIGETLFLNGAHGISSKFHNWGDYRLTQNNVISKW